MYEMANMIINAIKVKLIFAVISVLNRNILKISNSIHKSNITPIHCAGVLTIGTEDKISPN